MKTKYIASCSGGKDSTANIILAYENNEPLDLIIFSEVMYNKNISGELPEHIEFIKNVLFPTFESWGYKTKILHSDKTYIDCFNKIVENPRKNIQNKGKKKGFPMVGHCNINRDCKTKAVHDFYKKVYKKGYDVVQYVGIAVDEEKRLERIKISNIKKVSLLEKYNLTEEQAKQKCIDYGLLSPVYSLSGRGGCWFCPNAKIKEIEHLYDNYPHLLKKLCDLEKQDNLVVDKWKDINNTRINDVVEQIINKRKSKKMLYDYLKNNNFHFRG